MSDGGDAPGRAPAPAGPRDRLVAVLASAGGAGYAPVAPGTVGTLVAMPLAWALDGAQHAAPLAYAAGLGLAIVAACAVAGAAERVFGEHDSSRIVIDEVVGYLAAMLWLPATPAVLVLAFFAFRAADILKPFPARWIDRHLPGGSGVVLDDVVAGLYANLAVRLVLALPL